MIDQVIKAVDARKKESLEGLKQFLSIPSISAQPNHKSDITRCAQFVVQQLRSMSLDANEHPTGGHPAVIARNQHRPGRPTILLYGHYDVQPPEPMEQWLSPPLEPTVRKTDAGTDAVFARGAVDDK